MPQKHLQKKLLSDNSLFQLIDKVLEIQNNKIIVLKNVSLNEPFFKNQNFDEPQMPNILILEAMSQTGKLLLSSRDDLSGRRFSLKNIKKVEFQRPIYPGDTLRIETAIEKNQKNALEMNSKVLLEGQIVCEGKLVFALTAVPTRPQIHPTASVHPSAVLGKDVVVGPYTIIGENVVIGDRTVLEAHIMVEKWVKIGADCHIHFGCVIGSAAQDVKYTGEEAWVEIGDRNEIREYVTINRSTGKNSKTEIGSDNLIFTNVHIGHNCKIGNKIVIVNMTHIAGHVTIEDAAIIGGMTGIHQFVTIGSGAMIGGDSRLSQDVPPYMLCSGSPAYVRSLNIIGLKRRGVSLAHIKEIKTIYKTMFRSELNTSQALKQIKELAYKSPGAQKLEAFLNRDSKRGFAKKGSEDNIVI